nr:serine protease 40 isoform X3 [Microcebus murinus]
MPSPDPTHRLHWKDGQAQERWAERWSEEGGHKPSSVVLSCLVASGNLLALHVHTGLCSLSNKAGKSLTPCPLCHLPWSCCGLLFSLPLIQWGFVTGALEISQVRSERRAGVVSTDCGKSAAIGGSQGKIFGGQKAGPERWPWQASLLYEGRHICGAALIDSNWVASAAHCFQRSSNPSDYRILLGYNQLSRPTEHSRQMTVKKVIVHKGFDKRHRMSDDITLLQLHRSVDFSPHIRPVCLPESNMKMPEETSCWITGWGMITEDSEWHRLQEGEVGLIPNEFCKNYFPSEDSSSSSSRAYGIRDDNVCAADLINGKSICRGDSGGPLVCWLNSTWFLVGLSSWSLDCRIPISPSVFAKLTYFANWIKENKVNTPEPENAPTPPEEKPPALGGNLSSLGTVHRPGVCMALVSSQTLLLLLGFLRSL